MFEVIVILVMVAILISLGSGLYFLTQDRSESNRTVKSLTWRVGLAVALLVLLLIGFVAKLIAPHGPAG